MVNNVKFVKTMPVSRYENRFLVSGKVSTKDHSALRSEFMYILFFDNMMYKIENTECNFGFFRKIGFFRK